MVPMPAPKFKVGDEVTVKGFGSTVYRIVGYMTSVFCGENECTSEIEYDLVPRGGATSDMMFACEEDLTLAAAEGPDYSSVIIFTFTPDEGNRELPVKGDDSRNVRRDYENVDIEELLEMYADYMLLDRTFGGRVYKRRADAILAELQKRKGAKKTDGLR